MYVGIAYLGHGVFAVFQLVQACVGLSVYPSAQPAVALNGPLQSATAVAERIRTNRIVDQSCSAAKRLTYPLAVGEDFQSDSYHAPIWWRFS